MNRSKSSVQAFLAGALALAFIVTDAISQEPTTASASSQNNAPSVGGIPPETIDEGKSFAEIKLDQFVSDPEDKPESMVWTASGNTNLTVSIINRVATIKSPNADWNGTESITFTVKDPKGATGAETVTFSVVSINDAPVAKKIQDQNIDEGKSFTPIKLDDFITDIDHPVNQMQWAVNVEAVGKDRAPQGGDITVNIDANRNATIVIPDTNWFGAAKITFTATDGEGATATTGATFTVRSVNDLPILQTIPDQSIEEGGEFEAINLTSYASDADHEPTSLKWAVAGGNQLKAMIDKYNVMTVKAPSKDWNGPIETFTVTATDPANGQSRLNVKFLVKSVNDVPELKSIPAQTIEEGKSFAPINLQNYVADLDHRFDQMKWTFTGAKNLRVQQAGGNLNIAVIDTNWFGEETIHFTVTDPEGGKAETETIFTVRSVNDLVFLNPIPDQSIEEGRSFAIIKLDGFVYDGDNKDSDLAWEFSVKTTKPSSLGELSISMDANRVASVSIPDTNYNGSAIITFTATDPEGAKASKSASFTVNSVNDIPSLKKMADQMVEEGNDFNTVNLDELVTDSDHSVSALKWQVTGNQKLVASIDKNRVFTVKAPEREYSGPVEEFTFTVTDPEGGSASIRAKFQVKSINDAPEMKEIPSQSIKEGALFTPVNLDDVVSDLDHQDAQIKWNFVGNKALKVQLEGRVAKIVAPDSNWFGEESITFMATDPEGAKVERTASYSIQSVNDVPNLRAVPDQTISEGKQFQAVKLDDYVDDSDNKDDQLVWESSVALSAGRKGSAQLSVQIDAARIARVIIPDTNWYGSEVVTFIVTDPEGARKQISATYAVTSVNDIPSITKIPDQVIEEGADFAAINLDQFVVDTDHPKSALTWNIEGGIQLTSSIDKSRNALIRIPTKEWSGGPETFRFTVTDPEGGSVNTSAKFQVKPINDPPVFKEVPGQIINEGQVFKVVSLEQYISDVDNAPNQLKWSIKGNKALKVSMDPQHNLTVAAPDTNWHGEESITISVNDGLTTVERTAVFTVKSVNDIPQSKALADQMIDEGKKFVPVNLNELILDADHKDDQISWTVLNLPVGGKKGTSGVLAVTVEKGVATIAIPDTNWNGAETITFTGSDPEGGRATITATFTVKSINDVPAFGKITDQTIEEKSSFQTIPLGDLISDADHGKDKLKVEYTGNKDLKIALDKSFNATITTPSKFWNGTEKVSFAVTDPEGARAIQSVTLTVKSVNDVPALEMVKSQSIDEGKEFTPIALDAIVRDDDHAKDQLKWSVAGHKDLRIAVDAARNMTIKAPTADWSGTENLTIKVTDPANASAEVQATFEIRSVNDAPILAEVPGQTVAEGGKFAAIKLTDLVSDVDNKKDELVWNATVEAVTASAPVAAKAAKAKKGAKNAKPTQSEPAAVAGPDLAVEIQNGVAMVAIPDENWFGARKISFSVNDPNGAKAQASSIFAVKSVNDIPVIAKELQNKVTSVTEGEGFQNLALSALVTDADHSFSALKWEVAGAKELKVSLNADKVLAVTVPNAEWSGKEVLTLTVADPEGGKADTKLTYEVKSVNDAPVINKFAGQSIKEGEAFKPINLDVLVSDPDNKVAEMVWSVSGNQNLKVEIAKDRTLKIVAPDENWAGEPETITLTVKDPAGALASATATFTVIAVNDAPVMADIPSQNIKEGEKFKVINLDEFVTDVDNKKDQLVWTAIVSGSAAPAATPAASKDKKKGKKGAAPAAPVVVVQNLTVDISADRKASISIPSAEWSGERAITFTVTDQSGAKASKTISAKVDAVNDAPVLGKISDQSVEEGGAFGVMDLFGLVSDLDNSKESLAWNIEGAQALKPSISKGVLTIAIPSKDWFGSEALNIQVKDPAGAIAEQKVLFTVKAVNDAPVLNGLKGQSIDEGKAFELIDVSKIASDVDTKPEELTWSVSGAKHLKIEFNKAKLLYRIMAPDSNWFGTDSVTFTVTDPAKASASASVVFVVKPVNDAPTFGKLADQSIKEGTDFKAIDLGKLVIDPDNKLETLKFTLDDAEPAFPDAKGKMGKPRMATAKHQLRASIDEKGVLKVFTPDEDWFGVETFKLNVFDPSKAKSSIDVKFTVEPVNDDPVIISKLEDMVTNEGSAFKPIKLDALVKDADHKNHELTWTSEGARSLDVIINSGREALVKPKRPDFFGQERITFIAKDPAGARADVSAVFTVKHVNAIPVLLKVPDQTVNEDESFKVINMDAIVSDKDNAKTEMRWEITGNRELVVDMNKARGEISIKAPRADWNGKPETITFKVTDPEGGVATTSATYTVLAVNDLPVALGHSYSTREGETLAVGKDNGLLSGATDPDGDHPTDCMIVDRPVNGSVTLGSEGSFQYVPKKGFSGVDEFTFKVRDKQGGQSKVERVEINVQFKLGELRKDTPAAPAKDAAKPVEKPAAKKKKK